MIAQVASAIAVLACTAGCSLDASREQQEGPLLVLLDSLVLEDPSSNPVGLVAGLATVAGEYFVSDRQQGVLLVFDRLGRVARTIGRRGEGPGEWASGPLGIALSGPEAAFVSDGAYLKHIDLGRGVEIEKRRQSPSRPLVAMRNDTGWVRAIDREARRTLGRAYAVSDSFALGGPFPAHLGRSQVVDNFLVALDAVPLDGDTIAVFVQGSDFVYVGPFGGPFDSAAVPARRRRGGMTELLAAVRDDQPQTMEAAAYQASYPMEIARLPVSGMIALVLMDQTFLGDRMSGPLFMSIVDLRTQRACVDAAIPGPTDPHPRVTFAGDTLVVLSQEVDSASAAARTIVRRYRIAVERCAWTGGS